MSTSPESQDGPVCYRSIPDIYANIEEVATVDEEKSELIMAVSWEPNYYREAGTEACWYKTMEKELESIEKNNTWTLTELPSGHKPISLKWVFKLKKDSDGKIVKHKARLVATG